MAVDHIARGASRIAFARANGRSTRGPKVVFLGDSITANSLVTVGGAVRWANVGWVTWLRWLTGQRLDVTTSSVLAVNGAGVDTVISGQLDAAVAMQPDIAVVFVGTNDIAAETATATITAKLETIYTRLNAAGALVIAVPVVPRGSGGAFTATGKLIHGAVNKWIAERSRTSRGVVLANPVPAMLDYSTGNALTGMLTDEVHTTPTGAKAIAEAVATVINALITPNDARYEYSYDLYNATSNPTGNFLTNGLLAGTGGTVSAPMTGSAATSWRTDFNNASTTITCAASKETDSTYSTLEKQVLTLGGTSDDRTPRLRPSSLPSLTGLSVGDSIYAEACVEWTGLDGIRGITLDCYLNATVSSQQTDGYFNSFELPASSGGVLVMRTPNLTVTSGFTTGEVRLNVQSMTSGTCAGTIKISRLALRRA